MGALVTMDAHGKNVKRITHRDDSNPHWSPDGRTILFVAIGAAAPYFNEGRRGRYANRLDSLAKRARAKHLGLWGECPHTPYDPYQGIETRR